MGDFLVTYIMLNTDELGTVRPFQEESDSDADQEEVANQPPAAEGEAQAAEEEAKQEEGGAEAAPEEESKEPATTTMINTTGEAAAPAKAEGAANNVKDESEYEQEAHNYLSLALQIVGDFT